MDDFGKVLVFGCCTFCLGSTLILALLLKISAGRYGDDVEGCLSNVIAWVGISVAVAFFIIFLTM